MIIWRSVLRSVVYLFKSEIKLLIIEIILKGRVKINTMANFPNPTLDPSASMCTYDNLMMNVFNPNRKSTRTTFPIE